MVLEFTQLIRVRAQTKSWSLIQEEKAQALRRPFRTWDAHCSVGRYTGYLFGRSGALQS